jgi:plasmid stabilization system protein ParE
LIQIAEIEIEIGSSRATRVLDAIDHALELLREFPGLGHSGETIGVPKPLRVWPVEGWTVIFRSNERFLDVVRIAPSASDLFAIKYPN